MKRPLIGLALSATSFVLALGLCGLGAANQNSNTQGTLVGLGLLLMAAGLIGGIVCFIWLVVVLIQGTN